MKLRFVSLALLALISIQTLCSTNKTATPPNIVWIVSEDNSKHYMSLFDENGIETPNIEKLANSGVIFNRAFSNAAVCSAARSTLISSCYGPRMASHYHRKMGCIILQDSMEMFPAYLRKAGYYTTNNSKEDYNIIKADNVWDNSSKKASWRNRKDGQPFFHVQNIGTTHEGRLHFTEEQYRTEKTKCDPNSCFVQPNHPQTDLFKYSNALYRDEIVNMDQEVGDIVSKLKEDGLLENTFIFYYGDHGGVLPGSKGYLYETGLHVPLVVHIPEKYKELVTLEKGSKTNGFVSFVDFGATVLNLAGIEVPKNMDGKPFLGKGVSKEDLESRDETYSYADRFDEKYDMVRAVRKGNFKYIRNYQPFNFDGLMNNYRYKQLAYKEWRELYEAKKLNTVQSAFFEPKQAEALYDIEKDPFETNNLATDSKYSDKLLELRAKLENWENSMPDLSFYPEHYLLKNAISDPASFGQTHKKELSTYRHIANLSLSDFDSVESEIKSYLKSNDPWERYWALIVCSGFQKKDTKLIALTKEIYMNDSELINRVRAAEYLGLTKIENPVKAISKALYESTDSAEALLILNSVTLLQDGRQKYSFDLKENKIQKSVLENKLVKQRLSYLNDLQRPHYR
ncbi:sulfatase [Labilibaculum sp. DW002]|uniref:Sulfatase n=1 Tax=Paralabilibaculum antarcticum TaxID=2912572 RepID=A0ABT5VQH4_9BACT|nr:sulfatase [Labilibaculum sp. DW002]MDE5417526.1 sulfatase [Labilibaculum sp. DW002]